MKKNKNLEVAAGNGSNPQTAVKKNKLWTEILKHKYIYLILYGKWSICEASGEGIPSC